MGTPFVVEDASEYGPDFTSTPADVTIEANVDKPQTTRGKRSDATKEKTGLFDALGKNSPARSNIRKLNADDARKLAGMYEWLAGVVKYVHPRLAAALDMNAERCALSWCGVAEKNVKVRAKLLAMLEGGEWMELGMAHTPLILAVLPEKYVSMFMERIMSAFGQLVNEPPEDEDDEFPVTHGAGGLQA